MYLNIKPIYFTGCNCYENLLLTLAANYEREYQLAFSEMLGFEFLPEDPKFPGLIGNRIGPSNNVINLLRHYCGISNIFREDIKSVDEVLALIKMQLINNLPTVIFIDSFWCPWLEYQQLHHKHACLAIGVDANNIYCIDPLFNSNDIFTLPYNDFSNGYELCATFNIIKIKEINDYQLILKESIKKILGQNTFDKIREFASRFETGFDFVEEFKSFNISVFEVQTLRNLEYLVGNRMLYAEFIEYISSKLFSAKFHNIINDLKFAASKWNIIKGILIKSCYTKFEQKKKERITIMLKEIADFEESITYSILEINASNLIYGKANATVVRSNSQNSFVYIDLEHYFNNMAFYSIVAVDCKADFTGTGHYFLSENLPDKEFLENDTMKFKFPNVKNGNYDNISCEKQEIIIPKNTYKNILIMGCSEWGSYSDNIKLMFQNGEIENIKVAFSDWFYDKPIFNEKKVWNGRVVEKSGCKAIIKEQKHSIFATELSILKEGEIEKIILPDCPNIHIFAITLIV